VFSADIESMQSLGFSDLKNFCHWLENQLVGFQLQDLWTNGEILVFEFYDHKEKYLCIDTRMVAPQLVLIQKRPEISKVKKPVGLFLNSHAKNLRLDKVVFCEEKGRVLEIHLGTKERACLLEIQLIPKNFNLIVHSEAKKISWNPIRELPASVNPNDEAIVFDWDQHSLDWYQQLTGKGKSKSEPVALDPRPKQIEKKKKALAAIHENLLNDETSHYRSLGEALKISAQVPPHLKHLYNEKRSKSWNMETAFSKMKGLERKRKGTESRVEILKNEILKLENSLQAQPHWQATEQSPKGQKQSSANKLLMKAKSKGRKKQFADGIEAVIGKSAAENLSILRSAQGWDLWMHLKDFPGAHAIITRTRHQKVPQEIIHEVAVWLFEQSFSGKKMNIGVKFEVVVVECRFVRPIKGDRLGRVTYQNPQVFSFASRSIT
jgi:predicted ribosome quality control (RQC) complex YloA/Tae2 family protein